jgi:hypothetical protein
MGRGWWVGVAALACACDPFTSEGASRDAGASDGSTDGPIGSDAGGGGGGDGGGRFCQRAQASEVLFCEDFEGSATAPRYGFAEVEIFGPSMTATLTDDPARGRVLSVEAAKVAPQSRSLRLVAAFPKAGHVRLSYELRVVSAKLNYFTPATFRGANAVQSQSDELGLAVYGRGSAWDLVGASTRRAPPTPPDGWHHVDYEAMVGPGSFTTSVAVDGRPLGERTSKSVDDLALFDARVGLFYTSADPPDESAVVYLDDVIVRKLP